MPERVNGPVTQSHARLLSLVSLICARSFMSVDPEGNDGNMQQLWPFGNSPAGNTQECTSMPCTD